MKKLLLGGVALAVLLAAVALSQSKIAAVQKDESGGIQIASEAKNPFTHTKANADADQFQFAVVSDRTGGHRAQVFSRAMQQINLLQPEFVVSVGDLIEGYTLKEDLIKEQWDEFDGYVKKLEMPFFYVPGNHDLTNKVQMAKWGERYGRRYYEFTYKNALFLCLNSETPPDEMGTIDKDQIAWLKKTLAANAGVRWTFVFLHKPIWTAKDLKANGWAEVESLLAGRKYSVYCGHVHRYEKFVRNGANYYQLATTGGGSRIRGADHGEIDQVALITMKPKGPVMANVDLSGVLTDDLKLPDSDEQGVKRKILPTHPAAGRVTLGGAPHVGATVALHKWDAETQKYTNVCDGRTDEDGRFKLTTYARFDGAPVGEYAITITKAQAVFGSPTTTTLRVPIREGENVMKLDLPPK
jgi:5-hydroxyisourate hydrolase-like protein (transthyretin family)